MEKVCRNKGLKEVLNRLFIVPGLGPLTVKTFTGNRRNTYQKTDVRDALIREKLKDRLPAKGEELLTDYTALFLYI